MISVWWMLSRKCWINIRYPMSLMSASFAYKLHRLQNWFYERLMVNWKSAFSGWTLNFSNIRVSTLKWHEKNLLNTETQKCVTLSFAFDLCILWWLMLQFVWWPPLSTQTSKKELLNNKCKFALDRSQPLFFFVPQEKFSQSNWLD